MRCSLVQHLETPRNATGRARSLGAVGSTLGLVACSCARRPGRTPTGRRCPTCSCAPRVGPGGEDVADEDAGLVRAVDQLARAAIKRLITAVTRLLDTGTAAGA